MTIERLLGRTGSVREILGEHRSEDLDLSPWNWSRKAVLRGLVFERATLVDRAISADFVECQFLACRFSHISSKGHFWGASNFWVDCEYDGVSILEAISPQNRFENCRFRRLSLRGYEACETAFVRCRFQQLELERLRVLPNMRNRAVRQRVAELWPFPELPAMDAEQISLLFDCSAFDSPHFLDCSFRDASFDASEVSNPLVQRCDFVGARGADEWWVRWREPESSTAMEVLRVVENALGRNSQAYGLIAEAAARWEGRKFDLEWFDYVVGNDIPNHEYEVLEQLVDKMDG